MLYQKNGQLTDKITISIEDRAFMYGDGCFTTARWANGQIQLWPRHQQRFAHAIKALQLNCTLERIEQEAAQFIDYLADHTHGTVKIVISRGISARGYAIPNTAADVYFYFYESQAQAQPNVISQIGLMKESLGTTMASLRGVKSLNRLEQVVLKASVEKQGWQEALCFDQQNHLVEALSSNCFIYVDEVWITPNLALAGINGCMRQEILQRMQHYQIKHQVRIITQAEIARAEAVFLCNALQPMQMVQQLVDVQGQTQILQLAPCQQLFQQLFLHQLLLH